MLIEIFEKIIFGLASGTDFSIIKSNSQKEK
jgi:hypothetical protein